MVSVASVVKWSQRQRALGSPAALKMGGPTPGMERAPWGGQESGRCFDRRPGIAILELLRAEIAQR
jgi:hypothetical protein